MIGKFSNKRVIGDLFTYDLSFYTEEDTQMDLGVSGVIFDSHSTELDIEERGISIASNIYPGEILTRIIID